MPRKARRSGFGYIKRRKNSSGEVVNQVRYSTPTDAFDKYQGLRPYQYKTFGDETAAKGWLMKQKD